MKIDKKTLSVGGQDVMLLLWDIAGEDEVAHIRTSYLRGAYFTIWYGVYHRPTGSLRYASAGHPAAMLVSDSGADQEARALRSRGPPVGLSPAARYRSEQCTIPAPCRVFIFSDGVYEVSNGNGGMLEWSAFEEVLTRATADGESALDRLLSFDREFHGGDTFEDDFSILEMTIAAT